VGEIYGWQTELQERRLAQLQAISEDELQALIAEMLTAPRLPRLGLHFRKHGEEFGVETIEEYENIFLQHIKKPDLRFFHVFERRR